MMRIAVLPIKLRSDMHHIPKGASYFSECLTIRFSVSRSASFQVYLKEEDSFYSLPTYTDIWQVASFEFSGNCKPIWINVGRYHGVEMARLERAPRISPAALPFLSYISYLSSYLFVCLRDWPDLTLLRHTNRLPTLIVFFYP